MEEEARPAGSVGARFKRPLTEDEVAKIRAVRRTGGRKAIDRAAAAFVALWDVILVAAEGLTYEEAVERNVRFDVRDYAIPQDQAEQIKTILCGRLDSANRMKIITTWLSLGPASIWATDGTIAS